MKLNIMIPLADGHVPLLHVAVGVGCRGDWVGAGLVTWILLADQSLVLQQGASAGVEAAAGDAKMLLALLTFPQGEVWVPALVIFSIPITPWCILCPSWISILQWSKANALDTDIVIVTITKTNIVMIVIHITIHRDIPAANGFNPRKLSVSLHILGDPDQVISVIVIHHFMTCEQVQRIPRAWIEEQTPTQEAGNVGRMCTLTIHHSIPILVRDYYLFEYKFLSSFALGRLGRRRRFPFNFFSVKGDEYSKQFISIKNTNY